MTERAKHPIYARGTDVTSARSRDEIEGLLVKYGASSFSYAWEGQRAAIMFRMRGRLLRFNLTLPDRESFRYTETGRERASEKTIDDAWQQAIRERWRTLTLLIKAKLVAIAGEDAIVSFDTEMLPYIVLPDKHTVAEILVPELDAAYAGGRLPSLLPAPASYKIEEVK